MISDLFLICLILCCFFCFRGLFGLLPRHNLVSRGRADGGSTLSATADDLQKRVEVLERIATDRKTALREKFLDLE
ncbi:MAG: hypothetical protein O7C03_08450 [Gammaproteobacteria bacterium]|nr:hypothetical protein [Gammaproteobacteria bacterium]MCZ6763020.1 hypothetical protein [Gammaproteobacteria bacterium]